MKRILGLTLAVLAAVSAMAQGTVNFANLGVGVNAPVTDFDRVTKVGAGFVAQLWAGPTASSLAAVSAPIAFSTSLPGYFFGGSTVIPTVPPGSQAFYQVRVWSAWAGSTWAEAYGAAATDLSVRLGFNNMDYSNPLGPALSILQTPPLGGVPVPPPNLVGLTSFSIGVPVPEPSVLALGALAGLGLLSWRRAPR